MKFFPTTKSLILLFALVACVNAQGRPNPFAFLRNLFSGGLGGILEFVGEVFDTVALGVASIFLGGNPQDLACEGIEDALSGQSSSIACTNCEADIDVITTGASITGACSLANTCPAPEICGTCVANYNADGDLNLPSTFDGLANLDGSCAITGGIYGDAYDKFTFNADVGINGDVAQFSSVELLVQRCTAILTATDGVETDCGCTSTGCGALEISFACGDLFSATCISLMEFSPM